MNKLKLAECGVLFPSFPCVRTMMAVLLYHHIWLDGHLTNLTSSSIRASTPSSSLLQLSSYSLFLSINTCVFRNLAGPVTYSFRQLHLVINGPCTHLPSNLRKHSMNGGCPVYHTSEMAADYSKLFTAQIQRDLSFMHDVYHSPGRAQASLACLTRVRWVPWFVSEKPQFTGLLQGSTIDLHFEGYANL